jgi:hypothetical protein
MPNPIIDEDGTKEWYLNGKLHRTDDPAIEFASGTKAWFLNGELHREDGPAIEFANGDKRWYINDKLYSEDHFRLIQFNNKVTVCLL